MNNRHETIKESYSRPNQFIRKNTELCNLYYQEYKKDMVVDLELLETHIKQLESRNMGLETTNEHLQEKLDKLYRW